MNWLLWAVILCLLLFGFIGYKRGLVKSLLGTFATILALVLAYVLTPPMSQFLQNHTGMDEWVEEKVYAAVESKVTEMTVGTKKEIEKKMEVNPDKQEQISLIRELGIPDFIRDMLLDNNNEDGYKAMGVDTVYRYIAKKVAVVALNVTAALLAFLVARILLLIANLMIGKAVGSIPILRMVDRIGGAAAGVLLGGIIVWVMMFILSLAMNAQSYTELIKGNGMLQWLHDNNVLMKIALK